MNYVDLKAALQDSVGQFVGTALSKGTKKHGFMAFSGLGAEINGGFHEAKISAKPNLNPSIYWGFYKMAIIPKQQKTMAKPSNHDLCGEFCGEGFPARQEVKNG